MSTQKSSFHWWYVAGIVLSIAIAILTRFIGLTRFPPSLYWEEAALGYDAYSILQTAHDHHGHFLPLVAFESFGDFKPSFYFYSLVPSIALFGLTDFAVRFPSAVSGVVLVFLIGLIAKEIAYSIDGTNNQEQTNQSKIFQIIAMFIASLSPWAIQFSRGGWEVNEATTLLTAGLYLQLVIRRKLLAAKEFNPRHIWLPLCSSVILIALSMYTYHATRVVSPILLFIIWFDMAVELWFKSKQAISRIIPFISGKIGWLVLAGIIFTALISPILISLNKSETKQRFAETSLFADGRQVLLSNKLIAQSNPQWLGKIIYHRYVVSAQMIADNYMKHFSLTFLFLNGDVNPRHSTQFTGLMYTGEIFFLFAGTFYLIKKRNPLICFIGIWLLVGILPASLTTATPHALRILPSLPAWLIILTAGAYQIGIWGNYYLQILLSFILKKNKQIISLIVITTLFSFFYSWQFLSYWRFYSIIYPVTYASEWQFGYKEMVAALLSAQKKFPGLPVNVSREYGRPAMYYWFYSQANPRTVQAEELTAKKDQGEFLQYQNISFVDQVHPTQKTIVASSEQTYQSIVRSGMQTTKLDEISEPSGKVVWVIYLTQ